MTLSRLWLSGALGGMLNLWEQALAWYPPWIIATPPPWPSCIPWRLGLLEEPVEDDEAYDVGGVKRDNANRRFTMCVPKSRQHDLRHHF